MRARMHAAILRHRSGVRTRARPERGVKHLRVRRRRRPRTSPPPRTTDPRIPARATREAWRANAAPRRRVRGEVARRRAHGGPRGCRRVAPRRREWTPTTMARRAPRVSPPPLRPAFHRLLVRVPPGALGGFRALVLRQLALIRAHGSRMVARARRRVFARQRFELREDVDDVGRHLVRRASHEGVERLLGGVRIAQGVGVSASVLGTSGSSGRRSRRTLRCSSARRGSPMSR